MFGQLENKCKMMHEALAKYFNKLKIEIFFLNIFFFFLD